MQGGGLLGLYACAWLRHRGVQQVYCSDIQPQRLDLVADFGGLPVLGDDANWSRSRERMHVECPGGVDLVVEVTGSASVVPPGVQMLRPGGMYVWAGMVHPETVLQLTGEAVIRKCLTIRGMHNYSPLHLAKAQFPRIHPAQAALRKAGQPGPAARLPGGGVSLTRSRVWQRVAVKP